jgi:hypothetical protein
MHKHANCVLRRWIKLLLPPFQIIVHFGFVLSPTSLTLTSLEKYKNIYNIKFVSSKFYMEYNLKVHLFEIVDANIFFLKTWSKVRVV